MDLTEFNRLREQQADTQSRIDRAEGGLSQVLKNIKSEFGCATLAEAEAELAKRRKSLSKLEASFGEALDRFKTKWKAQLKEIEDGE